MTEKRETDLGAENLNLINEKRLLITEKRKEYDAITATVEQLQAAVDKRGEIRKQMTSLQNEVEHLVLEDIKTFNIFKDS